MYAFCCLYSGWRFFGELSSLCGVVSEIDEPQTSGIIDWFLAFISSFPEVQRRAHEELDRIIGRERWPTVEDEPKLPYIRAIIKEVILGAPRFVPSLTCPFQLQRVHAPFWMATPHFTTQDFAYNGVFIPKDTAVILNCYTLHHNEERYPDSYVKPFLVPDGF